VRGDRRHPGERALIKDLVVNLALEVARDPAAEFAISIAAAFRPTSPVSPLLSIP
jgi:hypothetical protein